MAPSNEGPANSSGQSDRLATISPRALVDCILKAVRGLHPSGQCTYCYSPTDISGVFQHRGSNYDCEGFDFLRIRRCPDNPGEFKALFQLHFYF